MTTQKNENGIDHYTWATPNGRKVSIMLEELKLQYSVLPIDITKGEQYADEFLMISPNNKIPRIWDAGIAIESHACVVINSVCLRG